MQLHNDLYFDLSPLSPSVVLPERLQIKSVHPLLDLCQKQLLSNHVPPLCTPQVHPPWTYAKNNAMQILCPPPPPCPSRTITPYIGPKEWGRAAFGNRLFSACSKRGRIYLKRAILAVSWLPPYLRSLHSISLRPAPFRSPPSSSQICAWPF